MRKQITLVAAMGVNRAIGLDGRMPWHLPAELQHFKQTTMGKAILMGRKTWQSIGRPLPGRQNIVISRNPGFEAQGVDVALSLKEAIGIADSKEVMVIGGGELYAQALPLADRMVLTIINIEPDADTWFPAWEKRDWVVMSERQYQADETNRHDYRVIELKRNRYDAT